MKTHANARLSLKGRHLLIDRVENAGWSLIAAAEAAGISDRTARKWIAVGSPRTVVRTRAGCSSRPRSSRRRSPVRCGRSINASAPAGACRSAANEQLQSDDVSALLGQIGPSLLFTHFGSGVRGWWTRVKTDNVKAIVAFEPGSCVFPDGEAPDPVLRADGTEITYLGTGGSPGALLPLSQFRELTKIPILIVWGDNIPATLDPINVGPRLGLDNFRIGRIYSMAFADAVNRHGGNAQVLELPKVGVHGNFHFTMWGTNHTVADLVAGFLRKQGISTVR